MSTSKDLDSVCPLDSAYDAESDSDSDCEDDFSLDDYSQAYAISETYDIFDDVLTVSGMKKLRFEELQSVWEHSLVHLVEEILNGNIV
jgi:hypothetical protein